MHGAVSSQQKLWTGNPLDMPGLIGWWDADDPLTITDGGAGTVFSWGDKSTSARALSQLTGANQPVFNTRTLNGRKVLDFDGVNDRLLSDPGNINGPFTIFIVAQNDDGADSTQQVMLDRAASSSGPAVQKVTGNKWELFAGAGLQTGTPDTSPHYITAVSNGASSQLRIDGVGVSGNSGGQNLDGIRIGNAGFNNSYFWDGTINEVLVYQRALSVSEITQIETYLYNRWFAFWPKALTGVVGWWDASDLSTITDAGAGAVSAWADKSGLGRTFSQASAGSRPLTGTRTQKGLNVLDFDGSNDYMDTAGITEAQPLTMFATGYFDVSTGGRILVCGRISAGAESLALQANATPVWEMWAGAALAGGVPSTGIHTIGGVFNGASSSLRVDGAVTSGNAGTTGQGPSLAFTVGRAPVSQTKYFNGAMCEIIWYNRVLTAPELTQVETYLTTKWV
jgi:hypothetical protein